MSTLTFSPIGTQAGRLPVPTRLERALLHAARRIEALAVRHMHRRAELGPVADAVDDGRRTAQALGGVGMLPR